MMDDKEYVKNGGNECPVCNSLETEGMGSMQADGPVAWQEIRCNDCHARWNDCYDLTGFIVTEESPQSQLQIETLKAVNNKP